MQQDKTAIITGAAHGIGAACARALAQAGYAVCIHYHTSRAPAEALAAEIVAAGGRASAVQADMGVEADILRLFAAADRLGPLAALVNNAAANAPGPVESITRETLEKIFHTNVLGAFIACREALARMKAAGGGGIVNITSEAARFGGNNMAAYAASKAALNTFTVAFAREAAAAGVRVNAVSPGVIDTQAHADATPERCAGLKASIPLGRLGEAQEVAQTVAWLLSDKASYVCGAVISVAGGR